MGERASFSFNPDGSRLIRHGEAHPWEPAAGVSSLPQIEAHLAAHLGPVQHVFHELVSDAVHVDVHCIPPTPTQPYLRLVTSGMSDRPMNVPVDAGPEVPRYLELMVTLPANWNFGQTELEDERWYWPLRTLKFLARLPHKFDTWLGAGHTIPNGDPPEPYAAGTRLCGAVILPSPTVPTHFHKLKTPGKTIAFMAVVPLLADEMAYKLRHGSDRLGQRLDRAGVNDCIDPARRSVAPRLFGLF